MVMPCNVDAKSEPRNGSCRSLSAARAVQKQTPLWKLVERYHGLGTSEDEKAQKEGLRHVFLDVLKTTLALSKVHKTDGTMTPVHLEARTRLLTTGVSPEFLEGDGNLELTRMQAAVLFGTEMARTGRFMSVSREYLGYLLNDFEACSQRPVAVPLSEVEVPR